jgi:hypothetical protein
VVLRKLVAPISRSRSAQQNHHKSIDPDTGIWEFRKQAAQSTASAARATPNAAQGTGAFATLRRPSCTASMARYFCRAVDDVRAAERRDFRFNRVGRNVCHLAQSVNRDP